MKLPSYKGHQLFSVELYKHVYGKQAEWTLNIERLDRF